MCKVTVGRIFAADLWGPSSFTCLTDSSLLQ